MNTLEQETLNMESLIKYKPSVLFDNPDKVKTFLNNYKKHESEPGYNPVLAIVLKGLFPEVKLGK